MLNTPLGNIKPFRQANQGNYRCPLYHFVYYSISNKLVFTEQPLNSRV